MHLGAKAATIIRCGAGFWRSLLHPMPLLCLLYFSQKHTFCFTCVLAERRFFWRLLKRGCSQLQQCMLFCTTKCLPISANHGLAVWRWLYDLHASFTSLSLPLFRDQKAVILILERGWRLFVSLPTRIEPADEDAGLFTCSLCGAARNCIYVCVQYSQLRQHGHFPDRCCTVNNAVEKLRVTFNRSIRQCVKRDGHDI